MSCQSAEPNAAAGPNLIRPTLEETVCNLCGGSNTQKLYLGFEHRYFHDETAWQVVRCKACSLAYVNPRPAMSSMAAYYPTRYDDERAEATQDLRYKFQLGFLRDLPKGKLLDVGCARGDWMLFPQREGWEVFGIEPGGADKNPHGLPIVSSAFPDPGLLGSSQYDVVTAWAVIEHLHDPMGAIKRVRALLRPGGRAIFMVPNMNSVASRFAFAEDLPRHLYFFSEKTLRTYGEATGLRLDRVDQCPQFFNGLGQGILRLRAYGSSINERRDWFRFIQKPIRARFSCSPRRAVIDTACAAVEKAVLRPALIKALKASGHIVAVFTAI